MKRTILFALLTTIIIVTGFAQQIPVGSCGIVNIYDAAGNRTKRSYFCNNGISPYPARPLLNDSATRASLISPTVEFQSIDALYPNPTTGKFSVTFSKALHDATISIADINGKVVVQFKAIGYRIDFDLSAVAAGVYFIKVNDSGSVITKKVIKQ